MATSGLVEMAIVPSIDRMTILPETLEDFIQSLPFPVCIPYKGRIYHSPGFQSLLVLKFTENRSRVGDDRIYVYISGNRVNQFKDETGASSGHQTAV